MPTEPTSPGEYLAEELRERGITHAEFAETIGMPAQKFSLLINGEKRLTPERAIAIGEALGTSAEVWMNLEMRWRLHLERVRTDSKVLQEWLTPSLVARVHNVTRSAVIKRCNQGYFKTAKQDDRGRWLIHRDEVLALIPKLEKKHT